MLTHINEDNRPQMVDISQKEMTIRKAIASGTMRIGEKIMQELNGQDIYTKKGPVFATAIIAATMAVKKTHEIIPFCHALMLEEIKIDIIPKGRDCLEINCHITCFGKTGVEMEALTGVHVAALTIYDMCKAMGQEIVVENIRLLKKSGGKLNFKRE